MEAEGQCYRLAYQYFDKESYRSPGMLLVHGLVTGQGRLEGKMFDHAWVEYKGTVFDFTLPTKYQKLPLEVYYKISRLDEKSLIKYTPRQVNEQAIKHGTYGPWDKKLLNHKVFSMTGKSKNKYEQLLAKLRELSYPKFVSELNELVKDPKLRFLLSESFGNGLLADDKLKMSVIDIPVTKLIPTQNEIDIDKSLSYPLTVRGNIPNNFKKSVTIIAPLVTYNNSFIIDGHHRWSQIYMINRDAKVKCINYEGDFSPLMMLKTIQTAIAAQKGFVPSSIVAGANVFNMTEDQIREYIMTKSKPFVLQEFKSNKGFTTMEQISDWIVSNTLQLKESNPPIAEAPNRGSMPQTDQAPGVLSTVGEGIKKFSSQDRNMKTFLEKKVVKTFSEITTPEEFREYAHNVMKNAHGDNYSEEVTDKVVDDLLKDNPGANYGELIGRLNSGFGDKSFAASKTSYIGHYLHRYPDGREKLDQLILKVGSDEDPYQVLEDKLQKKRDSDMKAHRYGHDYIAERISYMSDKSSSTADEGKVIVKTSNPKQLGALIQMINDHGNCGHSFSCKIDLEGENTETWSWDGDGSDCISDIEIEDIVRESRTFSIAKDRECSW